MEEARFRPGRLSVNAHNIGLTYTPEQSDNVTSGQAISLLIIWTLSQNKLINEYDRDPPPSPFPPPLPLPSPPSLFSTPLPPSLSLNLSISLPLSFFFLLPYG